MRVYFDVNVIVDWANQREPFAKNATLLIDMAIDGEFELCVSPLVMANVFYLVRKEKGKLETLKFIEDCRSFMTFIDNSVQSLNQAIDKPFRDFEDDLHFYSAIDSKIDIIVTRNTKDFLNNQPIKIVTPDELLYELGY